MCYWDFTRGKLDAVSELCSRVRGLEGFERFCGRRELGFRAGREP